jgi:predicted metal-binding membrane protein
VLAAAAWLGTAIQMDGMDAGPGSDPGSVSFFVGSWVVMMAAMMFPSAAPMVATYVALQRGRRAKGMPAARAGAALFVAGYLVTWTVAGLGAYAVLAAGRALDGGTLAWDEGGRWLAAGVLLAAAAYELTPLKYACLRRCRGPFGFVMEHWRDGSAGALRMGVIHGGWCVGCCWALMAALFALGAMSIAWMVLVALLIAVEKLAPWRAVATYGVTVVLLALAIGVAAAPAEVPKLTVPGEAPAMRMGGERMDKPAMEEPGGGKMESDQMMR